MTRTPDEPDPADALLERMRADLASAEAAYQAAASARGEDRLYERLLRYRRIIAMLEHRGRIAAWVTHLASVGS